MPVYVLIAISIYLRLVLCALPLGISMSEFFPSWCVTVLTFIANTPSFSFKAGLGNLLPAKGRFGPASRYSHSLFSSL